MLQLENVAEEEARTEFEQVLKEIDFKTHQCLGTICPLVIKS